MVERFAMRSFENCGARFAFTAMYLRLGAQTPDSAVIHGRVVDQTHNRIPAVAVMHNSLTGVTRRTETDGPGEFTMGGISTLVTGLPFNFTTGANNSGDTGATADRPVINGVVVGRNAGRGTAFYEVSPFIGRTVALHGEHTRMELRAEAFNLLNHANFVGFSGTYGNGAAPGPGFGQPLTGITNQLPARSLQFSLKVAF